MLDSCLYEGLTNISTDPVHSLPQFSFFGILSSSPHPHPPPQPAQPEPGAKSPIYLSRSPGSHHASPSCHPNYLLIVCQDVCFSGGSLERV